MRIKFLISIMLFVLMNTNIFAFDDQDFKVLSRSIEVSTGVGGGFIEKPKSGKSIPKTTIAWAQAHDFQGRINENLHLSGSHSITLYNTTSNKQIYHYKFELNCDNQYTRETGQLELQPGATVTKNFESYLNTKHQNSGAWRINVMTDVSGEIPVSYTSVGNLKVS